VARIVDRHHAYERRALPYLVALLAKVAGFHRRRNAKLGVLCDVGQELAETLEAQLDVEEQELFPALAAGTADEARRGLDGLRRHHRALALFLARVRWLADDFSVPSWAGRSYQVLMEELAALEEDLVEHMHLEAALLGTPPA
jgi:regulator of cell morphogenesis and NO signaling